MKEKAVLLSFISLILSIYLINFVSAQFYGGYSLGDILNSVDPSTMILGVMFIVVFALLNKALSNYFGDSKAVGGVVAFSISLLIIYGINLTGLDFEGFFYTFGFSEGILTTVGSLVLIGGFIYLGFKYGFGVVLTLFGGFLIILSFTDFIYETGTTFILGALFLAVGFWLLHKKKRGLVGSDYSNYDIPSGPSSKQIYKQELAERRYNEKVRQAQIRARAKNIQEIRGVREKRNVAREQKRQQIDQRKKEEYARSRAQTEKENRRREQEKSKEYSKSRAEAEKENRRREQEKEEIARKIKRRIERINDKIRALVDEGADLQRRIGGLDNNDPNINEKRTVFNNRLRYTTRNIKELKDQIKALNKKLKNL